jgi:hypothetical protein
MTVIDCTAPLAFDRLVDYSAGDLAAFDERRVEAHYCATVTREIARRIALDGLALRRYALAPGQVVPCTAAPDDDFVLVELRGLAGSGPGGARVDVETRIFPSGATTNHTLLASLDPESRSILLLFPADAVRSFPRSRWTMRVSLDGGPAAAAAPYVLDHTPWAELAGGEPTPG